MLQKIIDTGLDKDDAFYVHPYKGGVLKRAVLGLEEQSGNIVFPIENGVYRVERDEAYTSNFGFEWNIFHQTQLDNYSGTNISKKRFFCINPLGPGDER
jgi:hypothetical protein